jgi:multiple sugar transport system permease protein
MVLPALAFTGVLVIYPLVLGFDTSVHESTGTIGAPSKFVGLENYGDVIGRPSVGSSTLQTMQYVGAALILEVVLGIALAVLLHRVFRGRGLVLAILILPWALPSVVSGVLWRRVFDPDSGLLNSLLLETGIIDSPQVWLASEGWSTLFITLVHVWGVLPLVTLVFLAGLQSIPDEVYSASAVDGASPWRQFRHITLPLLRPSIAVGLTVGTVAGINIFDEIYVLNGTALNTRSVLMEVYTMTFANSEFAEGTALAFMVAAVTALLAVVYVFALRRRTV